MRQQTKPSLFQKTARHLHSTKLLSEPVSVYWNKFRWYLIKNTKKSARKINLEMSTAELRHFVDVLMLSNLLLVETMRYREFHLLLSNFLWNISNVMNMYESNIKLYMLMYICYFLHILMNKFVPVSVQNCVYCCPGTLIKIAKTLGPISISLPRRIDIRGFFAVWVGSRTLLSGCSNYQDV